MSVLVAKSGSLGRPLRSWSRAPGVRLAFILALLGFLPALALGGFSQIFLALVVRLSGHQSSSLERIVGSCVA
jgi:hypothetical protein